MNARLYAAPPHPARPRTPHTSTSMTRTATRRRDGAIDSSHERSDADGPPPPDGVKVSSTRALAPHEGAPPKTAPQLSASRPAARLFAEMRADLARRRPHYRSDWSDGFHSKVVSSSLFMFFTSIAPAITFAAMLVSETRQAGVPQIGPVEVIMSTALTGCIFSIFGGQPLCIVGVTGPVTIFTISCFTVAKAWGIPFLPFYCWVQLWSALMHMLLAASNACRAITLVSRYSCETFGMLIATIYIYTGVHNLVGYFYDKMMAPALLSLLLGLGTAWLALTLSGARAWSILTRASRVTIADYAATGSVIIFCFSPYLLAGTLHLTPAFAGGNSNGTISTIDVPSDFGPTAPGRSWLVNPADCPLRAIIFALVPAFFLTVLFFFDHNVSSLLCQAPAFGLKKGSAYHWDFFVVGVQILITGMLGIPPVNGLIPQAPLHTDSLCEKAFRKDAHGRTVEAIVKCHEQRLSNLMQALLLAATLPFISFIGYLPIATLDGLFLYMGVASFAGNSFYERIVLYITDHERQYARSLDFLDRVPLPAVRRFTLVQMAILAAIFAITRVPFIDGFFPLLIAVLIPVRIFVLPKMFGAANVDAMDADGTPPEEATLDDAPTAAGGGEPRHSNADAGQQQAHGGAEKV